jgi:hypothetical protein
MLETVACWRAKPALLLFRGKDLLRKSLRSVLTLEENTL